MTANPALVTATRAYSTQGLVLPSAAWTVLRIAPTHRAAPPSMATARRSCVSTSAPPYRPSTTMGTSANTPTRPTENELPVIS